MLHVAKMTIDTRNFTPYTHNFQIEINLSIQTADLHATVSNKFRLTW